MYTVYVFNHLSRTRNVRKWPKIIKPAVPTYHKLHQNQKSKENSRSYWSEYGSVMCFYFQGSDTCSIIVLYLCITSTSTYRVFQMEEINYKALSVSKYGDIIRQTPKIALTLCIVSK